MKVDLKTKRILFLVFSLKYGGAQKNAAFVMNACVRNGYSVSVLSMEHCDNVEVDLLPEIEVLFLKQIKDNTKLKRVINEISSTTEVIDRVKPDLIILFGSLEFAPLVAIRSGIRIIGCERGNPKAFRKRRIFLNKIYYKQYHYAVFQNDNVRLFYHLSNNKCSVIVNPCYPVNSITVKSEKTIATASRLDEGKGNDTLIKAFAKIANQIPEYKLIIYGDGPQKEMLTELIKTSDLDDRVTLFGKVDDVVKYISSSELFVMPSWSEGLPNVLIEAMSIGKPIVATDCGVGGVRYIMDGGNRGGVLVPVKDEKLLADAMLYMINNKDYAKSIGLKGRDILTLFKPSVIENAWLTVIDNVLGDGSSGVSRNK